MQQYVTKPVQTELNLINPVDSVMNKLTGVSNARAIITWLAEHADDPLPEDEPGAARYTPLKGL